ncbi:MAG TPA: Hsp20/alpha crystallin family protein [Galbitalea sp.]
MAMYFDPFRDLDRFTAGLVGGRQGLRLMPMDLYKESDHYILDVDLPGVDPGSIDIDVDGQLLTIRAQRTLRGQERQEGMDWLSQERPAGSFMRQLTLGDGIDAEGISANYENGVLSITIPVSERAKPRKIEVGSATTKHETIAVEQSHSSQAS